MNVVVIPRGEVGGPLLRMRRAALWGECDLAGILYTPHFLHWAAEAVEQFFRRVLRVSWEEIHRTHGLATPFVHASLDFSHPVTVGHELDVDLVITGIGRTSLTYSVVGRCHGTRCFAAKLTSVFVDEPSGTPVVIPAGSGRERRISRRTTHLQN